MDREAAAKSLETAAEAIGSARHGVALTGAGISVESGIPDFRSAGGLWSVFDPMEYATLSCFLRDPAKAWRLYRALGRSVEGKTPNAAHAALARLEREGLLRGVVTQNVDGLHQAAGSARVLEIHGSASRLACIGCGHAEPMLARHLDEGPVPSCPSCGRPLKPDVVLFEESVRAMDAIGDLLRRCDVLVLVGTSAEVAPASFLPVDAHRRGACIVEFNVGPTWLTDELAGSRAILVRGPASATVPAVADRALRRRAAGTP